ncbi:chemotaxis protein CheB [Hydrocarboniphaga sp.]|uniref:chemotaxis protein CheB n=1 Tax=Hydrocarboniphaga sp. TaxID=2033016 RepID=UPI002ABB1FCA|nr:chemotaxis protein CheB [Hydrocarboniphaga sp.]MDZ4079965.1 chemotaxis protein CheB [Hydrocarboniphaga sp.]
MPRLEGRFDAIVIGTSAGGVEALSVLLPALPPALRASVFVVLHLPRDRPSLLVDIFEHRCRHRIREAEDKEPVEPGSIYFAPPDYHLLVDRGRDRVVRVALSSDDMVHFSRPSIDVLFEAAADLYGSRLLGIVLTGGNEDGAAGLAAVRRLGGVCVVQDPDDAQAAYMPQAALKKVEPDFVLPIRQIAELLGGL